MKYEWKKQDKSLYGAKTAPNLINIPPQNYIMIDGKGNPNDSDFSNRVSALYSLAYAIKMRYKKSEDKGKSENDIDDFSVYPLEGVWSLTEGTQLVKENLEYTIMIRQPDFISKEMFVAALEQVKAKKTSPFYVEINFMAMAKGK